MSMVAVGITGFLAMLALMLVGMPIGAVMLLVGLTGGMMAFGQAFLTSSASIAWGVLGTTQHGRPATAAAVASPTASEESP